MGEWVEEGAVCCEGELAEACCVVFGAEDSLEGVETREMGHALGEVMWAVKDDMFFCVPL